MDLDGKVAVVTGSSRGIGRAVAVALAGRGAHVVVNYAGNAGAAEETAAMVRELGTQALVIRALMMAINLRKPPPGLIHHSDRGSQYASHAYQALLKQHGMICSMSRKGNCWDNAPVERFFSSLKREWTGDRLYWTRQEAIADVREYVAVYYNSRRLHSTLGYKTPMNYENDLNEVSGNS